MNNVELMNLAINFIPHNSKVVNIDVTQDLFRGNDVEEIIIEYIFRAGEYTMVLGRELDEWYIKEVFDCFENKNLDMRNEKKNLTSTTATLKTPVKIVPKEELIGGGNGNYQGSSNNGASFKNSKTIKCVSECNTNGKGRTTKVCIIEKVVNEGKENAKDLYLIIENYNGMVEASIKLNQYGIDPTINMLNITGSNKQDILISMKLSQESEEYIYYIYSYVNNRLIKIFDTAQLSKNLKYEVDYLDNYRVSVKCKRSGYEYIIDIEQKGQLYLEKLYDDCKLKKPTQGSVSKIIKLHSIINGEGKVQICLSCNVLGTNAKEKLAELMCLIGWEENKFEILEQKICLMGEKQLDDYSSNDESLNNLFKINEN